MTALRHEVITKDPDIFGRTPVFRGTRVRFQALQAGQTLDEFLEDFPTVNCEAAVGVPRVRQIAGRQPAAMKLLLDECLPRKFKRAWT
jgi:Protein of unknown function (DUF433)